MSSLFIVSDNYNNGYGIEYLDIVSLFATLAGTLVIYSINFITFVLFLIGLFLCISSYTLILIMAYVYVKESGFNNIKIITSLLFAFFSITIIYHFIGGYIIHFSMPLSEALDLLNDTGGDTWCHCDKNHFTDPGCEHNMGINEIKEQVKTDTQCCECLEKNADVSCADEVCGKSFHNKCLDEVNIRNRPL